MRLASDDLEKQVYISIPSEIAILKVSKQGLKYKFEFGLSTNEMYTFAEYNTFEEAKEKLCSFVCIESRKAHV